MSSQTKSLTDIRLEVERLAARISAEPWMLPTYGYSEETGKPHIEEDGAFYYYVQSERGGEFLRWKSDSFDELLFVIFHDVVSAFNSKEPRGAKIQGRDRRRDWFQQNIELMAILSEQWAEQLKEFQRRLLELYPFDDDSDLRSDLAKDMQAQGNSREEAWRIASEKYPRPVSRTLADGAKLYDKFHLPRK